MATLKSHTSEMISALKKSPLFHQVAPYGAAVSWPIPARHPRSDAAPAVSLRLPLFLKRDLPQGGADLYPPFAAITVRWPTGQVLEYVDFGHSRPWPGNPTVPEWEDRQDELQPVGRFPHPALRGLTWPAYRQERDQLFVYYDGLLESLANRQPFAAAAEFGTLLRRLLEPPFEPYFRTLAPRFCERFLEPSGPSPDRST